MSIILLVGALVICIFAFVILFGAPYLPTTKQQVNAALDLLDLSPGQTLLELGAGDGTVALAALKRGLRVRAIELNPILCVIIYLRTFRYRSKITVICGNFWTTQWGEYDAIYTFLLDKYMKKLDKYIIRHNKSIKLATFAFKVPGRAILAEKSGIFLYQY